MRTDRTVTNIGLDAGHPVVGFTQNGSGPDAGFRSQRIRRAPAGAGRMMREVRGALADRLQSFSSRGRLQTATAIFVLIGSLAAHAQSVPSVPEHVDKSVAVKNFPARAITILFVGNSFLHGKYLPLRTYNAAAIKDENFGLPSTDARAERVEAGPYGGIPGIFKKLTDEAGTPYEVHVEAVSAQTLEFHYRQALQVIAQPQWDVVVLQDYSTGPLPARRGGNPERFFRHATLLEQAVHAANPRARLFLYETWPRADLTYPPGSPYAGENIEAMANDLHDAYYREFLQDGHFAGVAAVGDAWTRAIQRGLAWRNPFAGNQGAAMDLWGADHYHPSVQGAYLAALVLFQRITGEDVQRLGRNEQAAADLAIKPDEAVSLQRTASEQVNAPAPSATRGSFPR